jgi:hypothetical protein
VGTGGTSRATNTTDYRSCIDKAASQVTIEATEAAMVKNDIVAIAGVAVSDLNDSSR